jgi:hypothetical protein
MSQPSVQRQEMLRMQRRERELDAEVKLLRGLLQRWLDQFDDCNNPARTDTTHAIYDDTRAAIDEELMRSQEAMSDEVVHE